MASLTEELKSDKTNGPETAAGAAFVSHLAALVGTEGEAALSWTEQELAAGLLKTPGGRRPFILEKVPFGAEGMASEMEAVVLRAGEIPESAASGWDIDWPGGLHMRDEDRQRRIFEPTEWEGRQFLAAIVVPRVSEKDRLKLAASELQKMRWVSVIIFFAIWILISFHVITFYHVSVWLFILLGAASAIFLYFQVVQAVDLDGESDLFGRLRVILIAVSGVFVSLIIFANESPIIQNRALTVELMLLGLAVTFATFAINPRMTEIKVLNWLNNVMRVVIAVAVSSIGVAIFMLVLRHLRENS